MLQLYKFKGHDIGKEFTCSHNWACDKPRVKDNHSTYWEKHLIRGCIVDINKGKMCLCYNKVQLEKVELYCTNHHIKIDVDDSEKEYYFMITVKKGEK